MRIFVIERLFSAFLLRQEGLRIAACTPTAAGFDAKFGIRMGELLWNLSRMKQHAVATDDMSLYNIWDRQRTSLLADWQIHIVWNLDDPFSYTLTREYREFRNLCEELFNGTGQASAPLLQGTR